MEKIKLESNIGNTEKEKNVIEFNDLVDKVKEKYRIGKVYAIGEWKEKEFDLENKLNNVKGPLIEVAGPTDQGYDLVDFEKVDKKLYASNVFPGCPVINSKIDGENEIINYIGKVDFIADGRELPLKDNSVGALFCSCLGGEHLKDVSVALGSKKFSDEAHSDNYMKINREAGIRANKKELDEIRSKKQEKEELKKKSMEEAFRVLEDGGVLVWQGGNKKDFEEAKIIGFEVAQQTEDQDKLLRSFDAYHHGVFIKRVKEEKETLDEESERLKKAA